MAERDATDAECLNPSLPPVSWLHQALIMPEAETATELSRLLLPDQAAWLSSLFVTKDMDIGASAQAG
jgi:hypothetical protein